VEKQAFTGFDQPVIILHNFTIFHLRLVFAHSDIIPKAVNGAGFSQRKLHRHVYHDLIVDELYCKQVDELYCKQGYFIYLHGVLWWPF